MAARTSEGRELCPAYGAIDLKSYYASVECVARGLDPLTAMLLVADESRSDATICLAVSPALKAIGVPSRPRLFEAREKVRLAEARDHRKYPFIVATPRMAEYERVSASIFAIYLRYVSPEDIHQYSIDECFLDVAPYLHLYAAKARAAGVSPAHCMALRMIRDVIAETGITATAGIGTNLYLAKVAMDIIAKHAAPDADGVRMAELDPLLYRRALWAHRPLQDFWQVGPGIARRLAKYDIYTMGDIARHSLVDEEWLYKQFGVNAEILIDHAWGLESCTMRNIKDYRPSARSQSVGQVLPRPYRFSEARLALSEMADQLALDLFAKGAKSRELFLWVSYDPVSLEGCTDYDGPLVADYLGRLLPKPVGGTVRLRTPTWSAREIALAVLALYDARVDRRFFLRRLGIAAGNLTSGGEQLDMFTDYAARAHEESIQRALREIRGKYGSNAILLGKNYLDAGTARERNEQIGGHKA